MKKLLSIVLALVLVLGSLPVFADGYATQPTAGETLKHYGFIKGYEDGTIRPENHLTREQLAALLAEIHGKGEEAKVFAAPSGFADEAKFPNWSKPYIAFAQSQGWLKGDTQGVFNNKGAVTTEMLATVLLRALGQDEKWGENTANWNKLVGEKANMMAPESKRLTRGEAFNMIWPTVSLPVMKDEKVLGVVIGKLEELKPVVKELMVESVKADNLKEIVVTFNHAVTKDSVVEANFALNPKLKLNPMLQEDGKTVVIVVGKDNEKLDNQKQYKLTASGLVAAEDATVKLAKTVTEFVAFDQTLPTVENVEFTGPKNVTVTFSEPMMKNTPNFKIKSGNSVLSVNKNGITGWGTRTLMVPLYTTLNNGTTYHVEIADFADFAGYKNVNKLAELTYAKDTTAPTAMVAKAEQEFVIIEFSKPVKGLHKDQFSHTFTAWRADKITATNDSAAADIKTSDEVTKVYAWFNLNGTNSRPIGAGTTSFTVTGKVGSNQIADLWGNKLADHTESITVVADMAAPEVKEVKVTAENAFTVSFTKAVKFDEKNIEVLDKDGKKIPGLVLKVTKETSSLYKVTMTPAQSKKVLVVNIKGAVDTTVNANKMADYSTTIEITDKSGPALDKVTRKTVGSGDDTTYFLYAFFSEDMNDTALTASNYQIKNGTTYTSLTNNGTFVNGNATVEFQVTKSQFTQASAGGAELIVANVQDTAENVIKADKKNKAIVDHDASNVAPKLRKLESADAANPAYVTGLQEVKLYFDGIIEEVQGNPFTVAAGNSVVGIQNDIVGSKSVLTLTLEKKLDPAQNVTNLDLKILNDVTHNLHYLKGQFDVRVDAVNAVAEIDRLAPTFKKAHLEGNVLVVTFDQNLSNAGAQTDVRNDFVITGPDGAVLPVTAYTSAVNASRVQLTVTAGIKKGDYRVKMADKVNYLQDSDGNKAKAFDEATVNVPYLESVTVIPKTGSTNGFENDDVLVFTFSEPVKTTNATKTFNNGVLTLGTATFTFATANVNVGDVTIVDADAEGFYTTVHVKITTDTSAPSGDITISAGDMVDKGDSKLDTTTVTAPTLNW